MSWTSAWKVADRDGEGRSGRRLAGVLRFMSDVPQETRFIGYQLEGEAMVNTYGQPMIEDVAPR